MRRSINILEIGFVIVAGVVAAIMLVVMGAAAVRFVRWSITPLDGRLQHDVAICQQRQESKQ